jgi:hypothetical protein
MSGPVLLLDQFDVRHRPGAPLIASSTCAVLAVAWTLAYFRPTIVRFLEKGGGNTPADRIRSQARRWIRLNWIRTAMVARVVGSNSRRVDDTRVKPTPSQSVSSLASSEIAGETVDRHSGPT